MAGQRRFLQNRLPELIAPLKRAGIQLYIMMGNDDCSANMDALEKQSDLLHLIHNRRVQLADGFELIGYSFVPITPFGIKDWEKFDFSNIPDSYKERYLNRKLSNYRLDGYRSSLSGWNRFQFTEAMEKTDSIQKDIGQKEFLKNPDKTIYVMHSPPDNTNLDMVLNKNHVGSMAIREFIEQNQPYLTLHGHIHETVNVSGEFKDRIGNTLCMSPGNHEGSNTLAAIEFDLHEPQNAKRIFL